MLWRTSAPQLHSFSPDLLFFGFLHSLLLEASLKQQTSSSSWGALHLAEQARELSTNLSPISSEEEISSFFLRTHQTSLNWRCPSLQYDTASCFAHTIKTGLARKKQQQQVQDSIRQNRIALGYNKKVDGGGHAWRVPFLSLLPSKALLLLPLDIHRQWSDNQLCYLTRC